MLRKHLHHAAQILHVKDVETSVHFYRDLLDFTVTFEWGEPAAYIILKANEQIQIHLSKLDKPLTLPVRAVMYIFVEDIDTLYKEYVQRGVPIHHALGNRDYQMRDFDVIDPDGHLITFGCGI